MNRSNCHFALGKGLQKRAKHKSLVSDNRAGSTENQVAERDKVNQGVLVELS